MPKSQLLLLHPFSRSSRDWLVERLAPAYNFLEPQTFDEMTLAAVAKDADVAVGSAISSVVLEAASRLKMLQTPGAGLDKLDLTALAERGITVCRSLSHAPQVAEHAIALLLAQMRKVALHDRLLRRGVWYRPQGNSEDNVYQSDALSGATIGLVGYGAINQRVASLLAGFNVKILVCARQSRSGVRMANLSEIIKLSDAVIVSVPLTGSTRGMIGATELGLRDPAPYIVNVGRAEVIDRTALLNALELRRIRGVAIDVPYDDIDGIAGLADFVRFDNALVSPHRAGTVRGSSSNLLDVVENLTAFAEGLPLKNVVDLCAGY